MNKLIGFTLFIFMINGLNGFGQNSKTILFHSATIHTGTGKTIENGWMLVEENKIKAIGTQSETLPKADEQISLNNKHVWPGIISLATTAGLREIDAVRATLDYSETGILNPHVRALTAYNTDSKITSTLRSNGIITLQACPTDGLISGSSSLFYNAGWNWEDAVIRKDDGIWLNWPQSYRPTRKGDTTQYDARNQKLMFELETLFEDAAAYKALRAPAKPNIRLEAMRGLFNGTQNLYIRANYTRDIMNAVTFAASKGIQKIVLVGGTDAHKLMPFLKKHNVSVILARLHRLPDHPDEPVDLVFKAPAMLVDAGITVALSYSGDMEVMGSRNLAFTAGTAKAYGLSAEQALQLITLNPAKIAGIDNLTGSLEVGKMADFFITQGDALDMRTAYVLNIYIQGKEVDSDNHQKELYRKYMERYGKPLKE